MNVSFVTQRSGSSVWSGNYWGSSIRMASMDENKNSHRNITMTHSQTTDMNRIALCAGVRSADVGVLASVFEKSATELKQEKLLKYKQTIQIATFNVITLNRIGQLPKLTASAVEHKIRHNMHTRTQIHAHRRYQISRNWLWMDASHCIGMEKLCQCHSRRGRNSYRT